MFVGLVSGKGNLFNYTTKIQEIKLKATRALFLVSQQHRRMPSSFSENMEHMSHMWARFGLVINKEISLPSFSGGGQGHCYWARSLKLRGVQGFLPRRDAAGLTEPWHLATPKFSILISKTFAGMLTSIIRKTLKLIMVIIYWMLTKYLALSE